MQWEYLVLSVTAGMLESDAPLEMQSQGATVGSDKLNSAMNTLGAEGWEGFSTVSDSRGVVVQVFFRRQKGS